MDNVDEDFDAANLGHMASTARAKVIKAVDKNTVHKICSGQVVLSLATAVKELVENSLDAGAKNIEVKLGEYGSSFVEVSDDGGGIEKENFQALTLKHHTSKISNFSDVASVDTFGFRGEALSSLCALSELNVTTRHVTADQGTKIVYDANGIIVSEIPAARSVGTTVVLSSLFHSLPVRRKEFERNLKREFAKMTHILTAYCVISTGVRISCSNQTEKRSRSSVVGTSGGKSATIKDAIVEVFGPKCLSSITEIKTEGPSEDDLAFYDIRAPPSDFGDLNLRLRGYVSSCEHGKGRGSADRQFYYINGRPCDPSRISKLINDLYHQYNKQQYPFVVLDITAPKTSIDVNVTPDKRNIMIEREKYLLAVIRSSINALFRDTPSTFNTAKSLGRILPPKSEAGRANGSEDSFSIAALKRFFPAKRSRNDESHHGERETKGERDSFLTVPSINKQALRDANTIELTENGVCDNIRLTRVDGQQTSRPKSSKPDSVIVEDESEKPSSRRRAIVTFSIEQIGGGNISNGDEGEKFRRFLSKIAPEDNASAELELKKHFSKADFSMMRVVGQFNKGFIIARLQEDLFIVDQHASDEKYNFERLQVLDVLVGQDMVIPQKLELTAAAEAVLRDNIGVFAKNGFEFDLSKHGDVRLTRIPHHRNWIFGKEDVDEMIFMLSEQGGSAPAAGDCSRNSRHLRPSRVRAMYASRACRTSVMVGTALSVENMKRMLEHMSAMEQPWNCPHGRPTMRHLINLNVVD